jgi:hypothetical protein
MTTRPTTNPTRLGFALALVLFGISLWLPAFDSCSGWECAKIVWGCLVNFELKDIWGWLYYSPFHVTNFTLLVLPILAFTPLGDRFRLAARWLAGGCFLHTLSWFVWVLCNGGIRDLKVGYYLWLLAVGILLASCIARVRQMQNALPTNTPTQVTA